MTENLDKLIAEYSERLMNSLSEQQLKESSVTREIKAEMPQEGEVMEPDDVYEPDDAEEQDAEASDNPEEIPTNPVNFSFFTARVFTADSAYAIKDARISIYRGNDLYAFLTTDLSGKTIKIKLEAFPEKNSLEPLSDEQRVDYYADVSADGFTPQKGLLVSAVGGADIVLNVQLVPESEGIN